jgi:hypothetical protein
VLACLDVNPLVSRSPLLLNWSLLTLEFCLDVNALATQVGT